jgi:hypothetical protein
MDTLLFNDKMQKLLVGATVVSVDAREMRLQKGQKQFKVLPDGPEVEGLSVYQIEQEKQDD